MRPSSTALALIATFLLAGCATSTSPDAVLRRDTPPEYQDPRTGVTVTRAVKPLIFGREDGQRSNLRDFISVMAAATNRTGTVRQWLLVYVWSADTAGATGDGRPLFVTADDRRLTFEPVPMTVIETDLSAPIPPPAGAGPLWAAYATDTGTLTSLAAAQKLVVQIGAQPDAARFELWDDQRAALDRFVRYMNGD